MNKTGLSKNQYQSLKTQIGALLQEGRKQAGRAINTVLVQTYWHIGRHIVEFEQDGNEKSEYGSELLDRLSKDLTLEYGKGFSRSNLIYIRKFYMAFPKSETVSHQLSWSHYFEILKADDPLEIGFYSKQIDSLKVILHSLRRNDEKLRHKNWYNRHPVEKRDPGKNLKTAWIPACAGMTEKMTQESCVINSPAQP